MFLLVGIGALCRATSSSSAPRSAGVDASHITGWTSRGE
jgi:hypothetical protein